MTRRLAYLSYAWLILAVSCSLASAAGKKRSIQPDPELLKKAQGLYQLIEGNCAYSSGHAFKTDRILLKYNSSIDGTPYLGIEAQRNGSIGDEGWDTFISFVGLSGTPVRIWKRATLAHVEIRDFMESNRIEQETRDCPFDVCQAWKVTTRMLLSESKVIMHSDIFWNPNGKTETCTWEKE